MNKVEDKLMHDFLMNVKWMDNIVLYAFEQRFC
jgi:hypothetical protein